MVLRLAPSRPGTFSPLRRESPIPTTVYSSRRLAYIALLIAVGLTGAYAESIPNFESITLVMFGAGVLLGARDGMLVGALTMLLFTSLNPYGPAPPLVMVAQVLGEALSGLGGAMFARMGGPSWPAAWRALGLGVWALGLTAGIPFSLWHIGLNVALFVTLGVPLAGVLGRYAQRLSPSY